MPETAEKVSFRHVPSFSRVPQNHDIIRVEIVTFDLLTEVQNQGFLTEAIYLKASFAKSEIGDLLVIRFPQS